MKRKASAVWQGGLKDGNGTLSSESGVLKESQYSFRTRFEDGQGTNPEELVAAAHAGCFAMALSMQLGEADLAPERIEATAAVTLEQDSGGFSVTAVQLDVKAKVPGADNAKFQQIAEAAKSGCPISKLLNTNISMSAELQSG